MGSWGLLTEWSCGQNQTWPTYISMHISNLSKANVCTNLLFFQNFTTLIQVTNTEEIKKNTKLFPEHFTYCLREPTLIKRLRRDAWSTSYYLSPPRPTDNWLLSPSLNGTRPPTERNSYLGRPRRRSPFLEGKLRSVQEGLLADYSAISLLC